MGHGDEPKMDDLKKLLRRLDGLDGSKNLGKKGQQQSETQSRGYVGALRGAPVASDQEAGASQPTGKDEPRRSRSVIYVAAATAALISTVTAYMMLSWQAGTPNRATGPLPSEPVVPSTFDQRGPSGGSDARGGVTFPAGDLIRQAERHQGAVGPAAVSETAAEPGGR